MRRGQAKAGPSHLRRIACAFAIAASPGWASPSASASEEAPTSIQETGDRAPDEGTSAPENSPRDVAGGSTEARTPEGPERPEQPQQPQQPAQAGPPQEPEQPEQPEQAGQPDPEGSGAPPEPPGPADEPLAAGEAQSTASDGEAPPAENVTAKPTKPAKKKKKKKKKRKKKKKKKMKMKMKHKVNQGTDYHLELFGGAYVQDPQYGVAGGAGIRQRLEPKKNHKMYFGLDYEYEPFSTKTLGFPEEDDTASSLQRNVVQPIHILVGKASRRIKWNKWVRTSLDLRGDRWWPQIDPHQRWSARMTPSIRLGKLSGVYGELESELYYKKFPNYYIAQRRIDQEGVNTTIQAGYNFAKLARLTGGFSFDYTHYLDARYNVLAANGNYLRSPDSKNYLSYMPFADLRLRPAEGLQLRGRYSFERQKTQHYDRVMTGRDEFDSLEPKFFVGYYDYRRHRLGVRLSWDLRDRLYLAAGSTAWVRHFDVYEARDADNHWTGELRRDLQLEAAGEASVRAYSFDWLSRRQDLFVTLHGAHVTRSSNMEREVSLATNFSITRVFLGLELRGSVMPRRRSRPAR